MQKHLQINDIEAFWKNAFSRTPPNGFRTCPSVRVTRTRIQAEKDGTKSFAAPDFSSGYRKPASCHHAIAVTSYQSCFLSTLFVVSQIQSLQTPSLRRRDCEETQEQIETRRPWRRATARRTSSARSRTTSSTTSSPSCPPTTPCGRACSPGAGSTSGSPRAPSALPRARSAPAVGGRCGDHGRRRR